MKNHRASSRFLAPVFASFVLAVLCACGGSGGKPAPATPPVAEQPPAPPSLALFAGNSGGPGMIDGAAAAARYRLPSGIALASDGSIYIADNGNHTIRKLSGGQVTTLAGSAGANGHADGSGAGARFDRPVAVAVDGAQNVYVADEYNLVIRKITAAGAVTTLAGTVRVSGDADGQGGAAQFNAPVGVTSDTAGNLYVVDRQPTPGNQVFRTLRKVTPTGTVTTVTTGDSSFAILSDGIAVDSSGNLFAIGVVGNDTIPYEPISGPPVVAQTIRPPKLLRISPAGAVTTLGLVPPAGLYVGDYLAVDRSGNVFFTNRGYHTVYAYSAATGRIGVFAGAPGSIFLDSHGLPLVFSPGSADGVGVAAQFNLPSGLATDSDGNLYIADSGNFTIRKASPQAEVSTLTGAARRIGATDGAATQATFGSLMSGSSVDGAGNVYVSDTYGNVVRKITPAGLVTTVAGKAGEVGSADGVGEAARFSSPAGIVVDPAGVLFVADSGNRLIRRITPAGRVTTIAGTVGTIDVLDGTGSNAHFNRPEGITRDSAGNLFVTDGAAIRKITPAAVVSTVAGGPRRENNEPGLDGMGAAATFSGPHGIVVDGAGNLYVADKSAYTIRKITPAGQVTTFAGKNADPGHVDGPGAAARFTYLTGIAIDATGNLYVSDSGNVAIRKLTPDGQVSTILDIPSPQNEFDSNSLQSIAYGGADTFYLTRAGGVFRLGLPSR